MALVSNEPLFQSVLCQYGNALWRLTAGYASDRADREDLLQEILVALWKALPTFRGDSSLKTFVYRVGHNRGITHRSKARRRPVLPLQDVEPLADARLAPDTQAEEALRAEELRAAIRTLPLKLRQTVLLSLEGLSHREIAETLDATENAVAVRLTRARAALRNALDARDHPRDETRES